eukprot:CAMPEP_0202453012 /NCGR_PEP_ID=MMETSP1360-20130828/11098_1 /ASSEMBLY_ACC=CAM_ASM_000848 /TAXON_ID=515479 /ORGANISM="Licmophora paradoxa, Strain CCMP2313" /LENGTH=118 /DNA_ID=CAMNT_0049072001 /DNA_START=108 /DNA_END=464 /DNA_ORIENTATION=+
MPDEKIDNNTQSNVASSMSQNQRRNLRRRARKRRQPPSSDAATTASPPSHMTTSTAPTLSLSSVAMVTPELIAKIRQNLLERSRYRKMNIRRKQKNSHIDAGNKASHQKGKKRKKNHK